MTGTPFEELVATALQPERPETEVDRADLHAAQERVRRGLAVARQTALAAGLPIPDPRGQLLRPLVAFAGAQALGVADDPRLWRAALAIQLAHEASLLHDDVIDGARTRRGEATTAASAGVAQALVDGDHLLTAAYRVAASTGSLAFVELFTRAVERTVAGEKRQAAHRHRVLDWDTYRDIIGGKSGELFACALGAGAALSGRDPAAWAAAGRRVGSIYQMVDDLLDYCPHAESGKIPFQDHRAGLWTWPLLDTPDLPRGVPPEDVARRLFGGGTAAPAHRAVARLAAEVASVERQLCDLSAEPGPARQLLAVWFARAEVAVRAETVVAARAQAATIVRQLSGGMDLGSPAGRQAYFGRHARTFRFAARWFPADDGERVAAVYAFCRLTDDLVDHQADLPADVRGRLLDAWLTAARRAYDGEMTGLPVVDRAMGDMRARGVPFRYAAELVAGARMDLGPVRVATERDLAGYTYRVASVVGLWLTELFGVHDRRVLERAAAMGHAMQLTNILRDVGEDLAHDRVYLPASLLASFGLSRADLERMQRGERAICPAYRELCEHLMRDADDHYGHAFAALPALPPSLRRAAAVAARAYQGIHDEIRRLGYDNLRHRAATSWGRKLLLGSAALWDLRRAAPPDRVLVERAIPAS